MHPIKPGSVLHRALEMIADEVAKSYSSRDKKMSDRPQADQNVNERNRMPEPDSALGTKSRTLATLR